MRYVGGQIADETCIFCHRLAAEDDVHSLILHRGSDAFALMNLYPYNTGHIMLVPNEHIATPDDAHPAALIEMASSLPLMTRSLRRVLGCDGFNIGMNVGAVAGAGVADHLHQHVVPRWQGDANFMPILASTMVLPELIPVTYAKIRAEVARELGAPTATVVVLAGDRERVLTIDDSRRTSLPTISPVDELAIWQGAVNRAAELVNGDVAVAGWAGSSDVTDQTIAITLIADRSPADRNWLLIAGGQIAELGDGDATLVRAALANLERGA